MENEILTSFEMPANEGAIIKVIGVGGGGSNAVNHMYRKGIKDVDFLICNTDAQALANSPVPTRVHLGASLTEGRGAGNKPEIGREAAKESIDEVKMAIGPQTKMVFVTAGMGGGTGTGAGPEIAKACREMNLLTIGIVTIPFRNEGKRRIHQAIEGIKELEGHVDSLLVINNEKIREMYGDLKISEAFAQADDVLTTAAKGIAETEKVHRIERNGCGSRRRGGNSNQIQRIYRAGKIHCGKAAPSRKYRYSVGFRFPLAQFADHRSPSKTDPDTAGYHRTGIAHSGCLPGRCQCIVGKIRTVNQEK